MPLPLQPGLLKAQLLAVLQRRPEARAVGFHSELTWEGPETVEVEGRRVRVCPARSVLEARAALATLEEDGGLLVLVTALTDQDLGQEATARLERGRLLPLEPWEAVRVRMKAREVDPLLRARPDLARVLIDFEPPGGLPAAPGGVVSADHVWALLFDNALGLGPRIPDARELLVRGFRGQVQRLVAAEANLRDAAAEYLRRVRGEGAILVLACAEGGHGALALPLGLACAVLFAPEAGRIPELGAAAARLEAFVGDRPVGPGPGGEWAEAALAALDDLAPEERRRALEQGDEALDRLRVGAHARLSPVSPRGFTQRLQAFARSLRTALEAPDGVRVGAALLAAATMVLDHGEARTQPRRAGAVLMALRLVRWLEEAPESAAPTDLAAMALQYRAEGAWVDRARNFLAAGDSHPDLQSAYVLLGQRARAERERQNEAFARALAGWTEAGSAGAGVLPVERVLDEVVVPLARSNRVLLVVLDGASRAVTSELYESLVLRGWVRRRPEAGPLPPTIATVPSVTEVSRASLLSGRLVRGGQDLEKTNFREHPGLRSVARADRPPLLHHKADLLSGSGSALNPEVASRLASDRYKVIGVVVNAVDDFLAKDDQLEPAWDLDTVRPLAALLDSAREAGRVVVLVADHGHVLEYDGAPVGSGEGERWRTAERPAGEGEILVRGSRVQADKVVVPWSEAVRYSRRHCGYHGGATPQEMLPPLLVLAPAGASLPGWVAEGPGSPPWWDPFARPLELEDLPEESVQVQPPKEQLDLFAPPPAPSRLPDWVRDLFHSESFEAQELLAGAFAPPRSVLARLLILLRESGGEVSLETLQSHLDLPDGPLLDQVDRAAQVLNQGGHPVLARSDAGVRLDFSLLQECFGPVGSGVEIEIDGARVRLDLALSEVEVQVLQALAKHGRLTEKDLAARTGRRRIGGVVETLSLRLEKAGKPWLVCEGAGDDGRVYAFRRP